MALLQVAKNPNVERSPEINVEDFRPTKLNISYRRLKPQVATALAALMADAAAKYLDEEGRAVSLTEAAGSYIPVENDQGKIVHIPVTHDWVEERDDTDTLEEQFKLLEALMCGADEDVESEVTDIIGYESLFTDWDLKRTKDDEESIPMNSDTFEEVVTDVSYFWPIWNDLFEALGEMKTGKDKTKNSKPSVGSGRGKRKGRLRA